MELAVKECCLNNVRTLAYLNGILKNWKDKTIKEIKHKPKEKEYNGEYDELLEIDWLGGLDEN